MCGVLSLHCETGSSELNSINVTEPGGLIHEVPRQYVRAVGKRFTITFQIQYVWWAKPSKLSMCLHGQLLCVPTL